jgi:hypothetical protein
MLFPFHLVKRHPFTVKAYFDFSLVITFAYPVELLAPLLPPGLTLDTYGDDGFVAIGLVKVRGLRPAWMPAALGQDFFLTGYRLFVRYQTLEGRRLRGLYVLRSDADKKLMVMLGKITTNYLFEKAEMSMQESDRQLTVKITTPGGELQLHLIADLSKTVATPPEGSPFPDLAKARRFAGPLPYTFSYEARTKSMVIVEGRREDWIPVPVSVQVQACTFLSLPPYNGFEGKLANAFLIRNISYEWQKGKCEKLPAN